jgi:hypothetical protein
MRYNLTRHFVTLPNLLSPIMLRAIILFCLLSQNACDDTDSTREEGLRDMASQDMISQDMDTIDLSMTVDMGVNYIDQEAAQEDYEVTVDMNVGLDSYVEQCGGLDDPCPDDPRVEITISAPLDQMQLSRQSPGLLQAVLDIENIDPRAIGIYLESSLQGPLITTYDPVTLSITSELNQLTRGTHTLTLSAFAHPDFEWSTQVIVHVPCVIETDFSTPLDPLNWYTMGDAYQAEGGWLEMTDQTPSSVGGIFLVGQPIQAVALDVSFKLAVEAELNLNVPLNEQISDGLAMTFWKLPATAIPSLEMFLTLSGSRMGYSLYRNELTQAETMGTFARPEAFTVEFDTYYNTCARNPHQDPTPDPHIAITYDGYLMHPHHTTDEEGNYVEIPVDDICNYPPPSDDPDHPWASIPNLLDGAWHDVRIQIIDGDLVVTYDGEEKIRSSQVVSRFKGGILAFSGGSGAVPAHLRFDDLILNSVCE